MSQILTDIRRQALRNELVNIQINLANLRATIVLIEDRIDDILTQDEMLEESERSKKQDT